jgi:hypothetical protein
MSEGKIKEDSADIIRQLVRGCHAGAVNSSGCGCGPTSPSGCCGSPTTIGESVNQILGYSPEETASVVEGANLGLGCGNPTAIGELKPGDVVLDLGSVGAPADGRKVPSMA